MIYLDYNATTPLRPTVIRAMTDSFTHFGNPTAVHALGRKSRSLIDHARENIAASLNCDSAQVVFTSGGSEANNFVLNAAIQSGRTVITSCIEHESVLKFTPDAIRIDVSKQGLMDLQQLENELAAAPRQCLVSIMMANNETGVCHPVDRIAALCQKYNAEFHCDAVPAFTKISIDMKANGIDYLTLSAHKIGGPKGIGAVIMPQGQQVLPLIKGGAQEKGHRAGTENSAGIAGFSAAVVAAQIDNWDRVGALRAQLESAIISICPSSHIQGHDQKRLPNTCFVSMPNVPSQKQLILLDMKGFAVSAGSACSSGKQSGSHVLKAMGFDDHIADTSIRISLGWDTSEAEILQFVQTWKSIYTSFNQPSESA